ncbi:TPA: IS630 family transposase, partial [Neisseria gonorrhoeae]
VFVNPLYYGQCKNTGQTAATFNLSRNTLYLRIRLKKQTGSLKHQVTGLNAAKSDRQKPARYVGRHPDACLHEIAKHFDCTAAAVCHAPKQMRMARKKRPPLTKDKTRPK